MMTDVKTYIAMLVAATFMTGCADLEDPKADDGLVGADIAFVLPDLTKDVGLTTSRTRTADMQDIIIIPFKTQKTITVDDQPAQHLSYSTWTSFPKSNGTFYYNQKCAFLTGVAAVLLYGRGVSEGSTTADIPPSLAPADIEFSPTQIRPVTDYDEKAEALAGWLSDIAHTPGWATTTDAKLQALYQYFIGLKEHTVEHTIIAGSSVSILGYIKELYTEVGKYETDAELAAAIKTRIKAHATVTEEGVTALDADLSGYPANIGLPDGAAVFQWISGEERFVPQTTTTTIAPITSVTRFAYPAELYFYTNSLISTSSTVVSPAQYESETIWSQLLKNYYKDTGVVTHETRAVAINTPIQYSVAQLHTKLKDLPETLIDGDGVKLRYGIDFDEKTFPMTAVIVGGQYPVGFDFTPETWSATPEEADMRFVYDPKVENGSTKTLVLQSYEKAKVTVVLELENRSGKRFKGKDGIVYPGAKFYLIGYVDPTIKNGSEVYQNRVFTQDCITTFEMTVSNDGLKNAYHVMPDLLAARMEIGVLLVPKWNAIMPTNVELYY